MPIENIKPKPFTWI